MDIARQRGVQQRRDFFGEVAKSAELLDDPRSQAGSFEFFHDGVQEDVGVQANHLETLAQVGQDELSLF
ncbi:hypothetical protein D3C85_1556140 [compost metagenome]